MCEGNHVRKPSPCSRVSWLMGGLPVNFSNRVTERRQALWESEERGVLSFQRLYISLRTGPAGGCWIAMGEVRAVSNCNPPSTPLRAEWCPSERPHGAYNGPTMTPSCRSCICSVGGADGAGLCKDSMPFHVEISPSMKPLWSPCWLQSDTQVLQLGATKWHLLLF